MTGRSSVATTTTTMSFCSTSVGQMTAMRTQLRRVLRSILNEVGSYSFAVAKKVQLEHVHRVVRTATDKAFTTTSERFYERAMGNGNGGGGGQQSLRPQSLNMDMLAYHFSRSDVPLNFCYAPPGSFVATILYILYRNSSLIKTTSRDYGPFKGKKEKNRS
jgi:hypothetical protein